MKKAFTFWLLLCLPLLSVAQEKIALFTDNQTDWEITGDARWHFRNGVLKANAASGEGFVITKKKYKNFVLTLDFKPNKKVNSGVFVLCKGTEMSATDCHEINIWDLHPNQDNRSGAIVTKQIPKIYIETIGRWNTYKIRCEGNRTTVTLNGKVTAIHNGNPSPEGVIGLQVAKKGKIAFRNILLQPL